MTHTTRTPEDARLDPQPGDTMRAVDGPKREWTVVSRAGDTLYVRFSNEVGTKVWGLHFWSTDRSGGWTWHVAEPAVPGARTPEDARLRPAPGDTLTVDDARTYTVDSVTDTQVRLNYVEDGVEEGTTWSLGTWSWRSGTRGGDGRVWAPAPVARDPRTDPRPGDTLRHEDKGKTWTVDAREGNNVVVRPSFMCGVHTETWTVGFWGSSGVSWTYAVAETPAPSEAPAPERDPKADPQEGDVKTWTSTEDAEYVHQEVVLARNDGSVEVQVTRFNGTAYTTRRHLTQWVFGADTHWTWVRGDDVAPAPDETPPAPEVPRAWYETRGLPACLAALPTPTDGELEALDLWAALEGLGYLPTGADDSGRVTIAPDDATVYLGTNGRYAVQWDDGRVYPPGGLATAMAAYTRARSAYGRVVA